MDKLLTIIGAIIILSPVAIWRGYVLSLLWLWFIVPTFNAPVLSVAVAMGVSVIAGLFTANLSKSKEDEESDLPYTFFVGLITPALSLLFGYLISVFM